ncbi:MAG: cell division protein FtsW [Clostridia bacterium]|nr:cell division protein FtsW [Clostridia bacterium]
MQSKYIQGDKVIWVLAIMLSVVSLLAIYSSTGSLAWLQRNGNTEYYLIKQLITVFLGLFFMLLVHRSNYQYFSFSGIILFAISIPLLIATLVWGPVINGARRYLLFHLPLIGEITFQTSDLAKLALIMYLARFLAKKQHVIQNSRSFFFAILPVLIMCGLIFPMNLSTALLMFAGSLGLLFIGSVRIKHLSILSGSAIAGVLILLSVAAIKPELMPRVDTWNKRIVSFFDDKEEDYQVVQSKTAIAKGGLVRLAPGQSTQRNYLPHAYSDYVYAIIVEEYGLLGGAVILLMFIIILSRSIKIARQCPTRFGSYLVIGISFMMVFQALVNMAVAVDLLPVTGQTLPFISMGGTSYWFSCIGIGMILSVSRSIEQTKAAEEIKTKNIAYAAAT